MYTGIVQGACVIKRIKSQVGLTTLSLELTPILLDELLIGASVGVDGVCLSVTRISHLEVDFDVMQQTLDVTTLGDLQQGDRVNVERSAKQGVEVGGHMLSGHIDCTAGVVAIEKPENNHFVSYQLPEAVMKYVFEKGFVAVNGCSLTVAKLNRQAQQFTVCYIPETLRVTTHGQKQIGDKVNVEIDRQTQTIVDTVERMITSQPDLLAHLFNKANE